MKGFFTLFVSIVPLIAFSQLSGNMQGDHLPEFKFEKSPGVEVLSSDLQGKNLLIVFFATWCGPCLGEMPHLQKEIWEKLESNSDFELLIFGREHCWNDIKKFKDKHSYTMPFYPDPNREIFSKFADASIPRSYVVNKHGKIVYSTLGYNDKSFEKLLESINELIK